MLSRKRPKAELLDNQEAKPAETGEFLAALLDGPEAAFRNRTEAASRKRTGVKGLAGSMVRTDSQKREGVLDKSRKQNRRG